MNITKVSVNNRTTNYSPAFSGAKTLKMDELERLLKQVTEATSSVKNLIPSEGEDSKIMSFVKKLLSKIAKSTWFENMANSNGGNALPYLIVLGNTAKEVMGTIIYTVQALTNEDLPPDKRKFVGMYDLAVGVVSTAISLFAGIAMVKLQTPLIEAIVGKSNEAKGLPKYAKAVQGMAFILPVVLQTIIGKRIIAPAIGTPLAGDLKRRMEAAEAAKNGKQGDAVAVKPSSDSAESKKQTYVSLINHNDINQFKQKLNVKS